MTVTREILINYRYLNIPVKNDSPKKLMSYSMNGKKMREFRIEFAEGEPDFWVFSEVSEFIGKKLIITVDSSNQDILEKIEQSDEIKNSKNLYKEVYRPQFHFSSKRGWINDPNGLVYYDGEYHLFYQHNPYGIGWDNMHWGHAVSSDLLHWKELDITLYPDEIGTMYSGSGIVDYENTAGFKEGNEDTIVLSYTAAGDRSKLSAGKPFVQCLAYSTDRGRTWTKYKGNPVIGNVVEDNRDPKIIWHNPTNKWVMSLYLDKDNYALFTSNDLKDWKKECEFEIQGCSECPDIFELPVDGDPTRTKWVFWGGNGSYLLGSFDGKQFTPESEAFKSNIGDVSYAGQSWSDIPEEDGRRLQITWARYDLPDMPFNRFMTFPCELTLSSTEDGIRLLTNPIKEIERIYRKKHVCKESTATKCQDVLNNIEGDLFDILLEFEANETTDINLDIRGASISYNGTTQVLSCEDLSALLKPVNGTIKLRILVDRNFIEIFGNEGLIYMPVGFMPKDTKVTMTTHEDGTMINVLEINELNSTWT